MTAAEQDEMQKLGESLERWEQIPVEEVDSDEYERVFLRYVELRKQKEGESE